MSWPPTLQDLKDELRIDHNRDDRVLARKLASAIGFVNDQLADPAVGYFVPPAEPGTLDRLVEGTLLLASRLYARRNSPDGLVAMGDLGSASVPGFDADVERMLGIGRQRGSFTV